MSPLRARVDKGRPVLDEPTTLPDGTVIDLVADDEGDNLTEDERRILHEALRLHGSLQRRVGYGPHRRSSASCVTVGEPAGYHYSRG
jgi:hypothetical protein